MAILDTHFTSLALSPSVLLALAFALLGGLYVLFVQRESFPSSAPAIAHGSLPVFGQIGYWTERYDFWLRALSQSKTKNFSFYLGTRAVLLSDTGIADTTLKENTASLEPTQTQVARLSSRAKTSTSQPGM